MGLAGVKEHVRALTAQVRLDRERRRHGMPVERGASLHCVFRGPPGTGKTTVARLLARALGALGAVRAGDRVVECDRGALVAPYMGQTALKVREAFDRASGGVLFVDEAHALVESDKDAFGREALDTLVKLLEDRRGDVVVVLAGYSAEMAALFRRNPGLASRFPRRLRLRGLHGGGAGGHRARAARRAGPRARARRRRGARRGASRPRAAQTAAPRRSNIVGAAAAARSIASSTGSRRPPDGPAGRTAASSSRPTAGLDRTGPTPGTTLVHLRRTPRHRVRERRRHRRVDVGVELGLGGAPGGPDAGGEAPGACVEINRRVGRTVERRGPDMATPSSRYQDERACRRT